jgi:hypothetical protein
VPGEVALVAELEVAGHARFHATQLNIPVGGEFNDVSNRGVRAHRRGLGEDAAIL